MSKLQKSPEHTANQGQTCEETCQVQTTAGSGHVEEPRSSSHLPMAGSLKGQTGEEAQVPKASEEPCNSRQLIMADNQKDLAHGSPSPSRGLQLPCASSGDCAEGLGHREVQGGLAFPPHHPDLSVIVIDGKVNFLVNYMLVKYQAREMLSMSDIMALIVREDSDHYQEIFVRASERMEMVFGLGVREVDAINHFYTIFIKLGLTYDGMRSHEFSFPKTGLLILILGIIFMKGNHVTEEDIWEALSPMGIYPGMDHCIFGEPRELITHEFVMEGYLARQPLGNTDPMQCAFVWGPWAKAETSKMRVLKFVAKVHGSDPTAFPFQYEEALLGEERCLGMILESQ